MHLRNLKRPSKRRRNLSFIINTKLKRLIFIIALSAFCICPVYSQHIKWIANLDKALRKADETGKPVFVYIYQAFDPIHDRNLEQAIFECFINKQVGKASKDLVCTKVFAPANKKAVKKLEFNTTQKYAFIFLDPDGVKVKETKTTDPGELTEIMQEVAQEYTRKIIWKETLSENILNQELKPVFILVYKKAKDKDSFDKKTARYMKVLDKVPLRGFAEKFLFVKIEFHKKCKDEKCLLCKVSKTFRISKAPCILLINPLQKKPKRKLVKKFSGTLTVDSIKDALKSTIKKFQRDKKKKKKKKRK